MVPDKIKSGGRIAREEASKGRLNMTYTFKLSRRLAVAFLSGAVALGALVLVAVGFLIGSSPDTAPCGT